jgi:hypothetical protein
MYKFNDAILGAYSLSRIVQLRRHLIAPRIKIAEIKGVSSKHTFRDKQLPPFFEVPTDQGLSIPTVGSLAHVWRVPRDTQFPW